jgi:hypothetical protein
MRLQRTVLGANGKPTLGKLTSRDGKFMCVTLERPADGDHPCIPAGIYQVGIDWHHPTDLEKRYRCPELQDVPGRSQIQIHVANRCGELLGCIAPGERIGPDCVEASKSAFDRLMAYLEGAALPFTLEVVDP